jgi:hypothetical protein
MPRASHRVRGARGLRGRLVGSRSERIRIPAAVPRRRLRLRPLEGSGRFHVEHNSGRPAPGRRRAWVAPRGAEPSESGSAGSSRGLPLRSPLGRRSAVCRISLPPEHRNTPAAARVQRRARDLAFAWFTPRIRVPRGLMQQAASYSVRPPEARDSVIQSGPLRSGRSESPRRLTAKWSRPGGMSGCRDVGMGYAGHLPTDSLFHVERHASDRSVRPSGGCSRNERAIQARATREAQGTPGKPWRLR